jgi:hypothetical protein
VGFEGDADVEMEETMLAYTEKLLAKLSQPKFFEKIGRKTLLAEVAINLTKEEVDLLNCSSVPQELLKLERDMNGGGESKLALDGPVPHDIMLTPGLTNK